MDGLGDDGGLTADSERTCSEGSDIAGASPAGTPRQSAIAPSISKDQTRSTSPSGAAVSSEPTDVSPVVTTCARTNVAGRPASIKERG